MRGICQYARNIDTQICTSVRNIFRGRLMTSLFCQFCFLMQAVFSAIFFFATLALFDGWLLVGYSTFYTMAPVFSFVLGTTCCIGRHIISSHVVLLLMLRDIIDLARICCKGVTYLAKSDHSFWKRTHIWRERIEKPNYIEHGADGLKRTWT